MDVTTRAVDARVRPVSRDGWPAVMAGLAVLCWSLGLAGLLVAVVSGTAADLSWPDFALGLAYPAVALLAAHVREARRWSALTLMSALASSLNVAATSWADRMYRAHVHPVPAAPWAAWLASWTWVVSIIGFAAIAYFPDGRLPSPRWRFAPLALAVAGSVIALGNATDRRIGDYGIASPLPGPRLSLPGAASAGMVGLAAAGLVGCLACIIVKFRRSDGVTRRQIGWYGYGYGVTVVVLAIAVTTSLPSALLAIAPLTVAAGAGVAILKYRLYDIDRVVNRTLAWGLITVLVIALYFVCVGFFQRLFAGGGSVGGLLATAIVAVAFQPLRIMIQGAVNQLIYGYRDQPDVVFRELAGALTGRPAQTAPSPRWPARSPGRCGCRPRRSTSTGARTLRRRTPAGPSRRERWSRPRRRRTAAPACGSWSSRAAAAASPAGTGSSLASWPLRLRRLLRPFAWAGHWRLPGYGLSPPWPKSSAGCGGTCTTGSDRCSPGCA